ncbi:MAG: hypothetical protein U5Q03_10675 [Bacteroidota bacterium]|nr:hypothetical protein [Bacteroidota bacterium]
MDILLNKVKKKSYKGSVGDNVFLGYQYRLVSKGLMMYGIIHSSKRLPRMTN